MTPALKKIIQRFRARIRAKTRIAVLDHPEPSPEEPEPLPQPLQEPEPPHEGSIEAPVSSTDLPAQHLSSPVAPPTVSTCAVCLGDMSPLQTYTTPCHHQYCTLCVSSMAIRQPDSAAMGGYKPIACPLCRTQFYYVKQKPPFSLDLYPSSADFDYVTEPHERHMLLSAYRTICQQQGMWEFLYHFRPDDAQLEERVGDPELQGVMRFLYSYSGGFVWSRSPEMVGLMVKIEEEYQNGHSGSSMGFTMRAMHYIAQWGYDSYASIR
jgi:hypothetical protein